MPGLDVRWIHGAPDCALSADPPLQVYAYDKDTYILRQSKCTHFEAPFLYLLFGTEKALLIDTGAGGVPVRSVVQGSSGSGRRSTTGPSWSWWWRTPTATRITWRATISFAVSLGPRW